jgi:hypothetical protein
MTLTVGQIEFGSLLTYCPRRSTPEEQESAKLMLALKNDEYVQVGSAVMLMSDWVASEVKRRFATLQFGHFFRSNPILVPVPKSSLMTPGMLWVPDRLAKALVKNGIGKEVSRMLERTVPIRKAALSDSWARPTALEHFQTLSAIQTISKPNEILLIDDVVTRGATLLGAANRLLDSYPEATVRAFAAMRTQSSSFSFKNDSGSSTGIITLLANGNTQRRP